MNHDRALHDHGTSMLIVSVAMPMPTVTIGEGRSRHGSGGGEDCDFLGKHLRLLCELICVLHFTRRAAASKPIKCNICNILYLEDYP
jgi:hypothetical protein